MVSSGFFKKCFQRPGALGEGIKTNVADKLDTSLLNNAKNLVTDHIPLPNLSNIPMPSLPNMPQLPRLVEHIISPLKTIFGNLLNFRTILMVLGGLLAGLFSLLSGGIAAITAIAAMIAWPLAAIPIVLGLVVATVVVTVVVVVVIVTLWYFFFNDRNTYLGFLEYFGRGVKKFNGKVVWLMGASTSLGEAIALELATAGAKIVLSARREEILQRLKANCIEKSKGKLKDSDILVLPFSVTEMEETYVQDVINHFGKIDVLINNIGHIELGEACGMNMAMDKATFEINFFGPVFYSKQVIRHFKETGGGHIILVSSLSGKFGIPGQATHSASKQALNAYFESLRLECGKHKIGITTVCPGLIVSSVTDCSVLATTRKLSQEEASKMTRKGLRTKRCAHLILVAGANKCNECWVSNQPFLFLTYVAQLFPTVHQYIMSWIFSKERLQKIYEGKSPNMWMWRPMFVI